MKPPATPSQHESDPLEGVVLVSRDGTVLNSNSRAWQLLESNSFQAEDRLPKAFREFHMRFVQSGKRFSADRLRSLRTGKELLVCVYLLDTNEDLDEAAVLQIRDPSDLLTVVSRGHEAFTRPIGDCHPLSSEPLGAAFQALKGEDNLFQRTLLQAQKAAKVHFPTLIVGESGTGKEGVAKAIHEASERSDKPFVDINCAAIPDSLIESELFGYEGGAFTGARRAGRTGLFELAHGGTIFLDEIGDASSQTQAKILRVLQEGRFKRIGGKRNVEVDIRPIAATNRNLGDLISQGEFRQDLLYRLNTITINLPPLRERRGDIRLLAEHFLRDHGQAQGTSFSFSTEAVRLMEAYKWPGNVRELKGVVDYAATMASTPILTADSLPSFMKETSGGMFDESEAERLSSGDETGLGLLNRTVQEVERSLIERVLSQSRTRSEAIKTLGISRRAFYLKIKKYGLD
jgi:transcriptional regulator with PAS, ATPase and Fis domain